MNYHSPSMFAWKCPVRSLGKMYNHVFHPSSLVRLKNDLLIYSIITPNQFDPSIPSTENICKWLYAIFRKQWKLFLFWVFLKYLILVCFFFWLICNYRLSHYRVREVFHHMTRRNMIQQGCIWYRACGVSFHTKHFLKISINLHCFVPI